MKKTVSKFLIILCAIAFVDCNCSTCQEANESYTTNVERVKYNGYSSAMVTKAEYGGHTYIFFNDHYRLGVVHDPDCKCHKNGETNFDW